MHFVFKSALIVVLSAQTFAISCTDSNSSGKAEPLSETIDETGAMFDEAMSDMEREFRQWGEKTDQEKTALAEEWEDLEHKVEDGWDDMTDEAKKQWESLKDEWEEVVNG